MKTYSVLFAEDVPHYGTAEIEAEDDAAALETALNRLIVRLTEAQGYLGHGNDAAAIGTLLDLEDLHSDLQAALRLFKSRRFS